MGFTRLRRWLWARKRQQEPTSSHTPPSNSSYPDLLGFREPEHGKFISNKGPKMRSSSSGRSKGKWQSREERQMVEAEYDLVLVPPACERLSGFESDDSDWSIGWEEPHAADFQSSGKENSFAVLVPCYGRECNEQQQLVAGTIDILNGHPSEEEKYIEEWLSSLLNS